MAFFPYEMALSAYLECPIGARGFRGGAPQKKGHTLCLIPGTGSSRSVPWGKWYIKVYPAIRGSDIERWMATPKIFILMTQDPQKRQPYPETQMKSNWPKTFSYLIKFKKILLSRSSKSIRDLMNRTAFYAMFGIGPYTISPYKVAWKFMSNDIFASVISQHKTVFGYKTVIPTKTVAIFSTDTESEAHYLCAIINSKPVRDFIKSFSSAGRGFGTPSVMEHVGIPKFNPKNPLHLKLAEISKKCHQLKAEGKEKEIEKLEKENDELVKKLFNIK
ncbi:MAG: hypothetical protein NZ602_15565 [Thermoguttaceae bacterium]|nr:hypothetical protein [Thermoguttaceae bacterium]MDW8037580.1 hypothetical protein [Thermoguttaceae bacterium]